jgi:hypothetical protein
LQKHDYSVDVDGNPREVWQLFWYRGPRPAGSAGEASGVSIEILHPGDEIGEGLVRHCTFRVPKYLFSGGVGHSWEWLTQVKPYESWKYDAVGKPLWSKAEGRTRLEELPDGRTRIHFSETYLAFNPVLRVLLERRVHEFISRDNDTLIRNAINSGLERMRAAASRRPSGGSSEASGTQ